MPGERDSGTENTMSGEAVNVIQAGSITGPIYLQATDQQVPAAPPRELPSEVYGFTNRHDQLAQLDALLASLDESSTAVVVTAVTGTAGVGKTAFATHWAHRASNRFPDGQLYVNLRGYDPDQAVSAGEALSGFLHALGVREEDVPHNLDERAARFRSLTAGKRVLIVLDNARTVDQVRPLLPGSSSCVVLVTSRDALPGLVTREGAHRIDLDLLTPNEAIVLLRTLINERIDAEPDKAVALIQQCARLPLALRIAAELVVSRSVDTLAELVDDLTDEQSRLDLLDAGDDPYTAVRAVLSWSYRNLDPLAARTFRLMGLNPGRDFDAHIAAALTAAPVAQARRQLATLVRAHLAERTRSARYEMHDLLRVYSADLAVQDESEESRHAAIRRLLAYYLHTASAAMNVVVPHERDRRPEVPTSAIPPPSMPDASRATDWLEKERANLLATAAYSARGFEPSYAGTLSLILYRYFDIHSHFDEGVALHTYAVTACRRTGDQVVLGRALHNLGVVYQRLGRYHEAVHYMRESLDAVEACGHRPGQAFVLSDLGMTHWLLGRNEQAFDYLDHALAMFRDLGDITGQGSALCHLGLLLGRGLNRYGEARDHLIQALEIFEDTDDTVRKGYAVSDLGTVYRELGHHELALDHYQKALALARETHDRSLEAAALNGLGSTNRAAGVPLQVMDYHTKALEIASEIGDRFEQAQSHEGLARAHHGLGYLDEARRNWQQALAIYGELGAPEAAEAEIALAELDDRRS